MGPWRPPHKLAGMMDATTENGVTQAQSRSAIMWAQDKGFYEEEDLNGSRSKTGRFRIYRAQHRFWRWRTRDVAVEWMPCRFGRASEKGLPDGSISHSRFKVVWH